MAYRINYRDGTKDTAETLAEAHGAVRRQYSQAVYCDNGDVSDEPSAGELRSAGRILVWADRDDSAGPDGNGDDGSQAVAEIVAG